MSRPKLLIEQWLPIETIGAECMRDASAAKKPPLNRLHIWWARRPLTVSRAAILVLQRRLSRPTSHAAPSQFGEAPLAMAGGRPSIPFLAPVGPPQDFVHVPDANLQQMDQHGSHLGHAHLWLFFPPAVPVGAQGT